MVGPGGAPHVGVAAAAERPAQRLDADRVAFGGRHVGVRAGLLEDLRGLLVGGAVQHVLFGLDLGDLLLHRRGQPGGLGLLLLRGQHGALGGVLRGGRGGDPVAVLVLQLQHDRDPVDEPLRVAALQQLQGRVEAAGHVALGGDLADRELARGQLLGVALGGLAGQRGLGPGFLELNLQRVVLVAEHLDLAGHLVGLGQERLHASARRRGDAVVAWAPTLRLAGRANPASRTVPVTKPVRAHAR